MKILVISDSHGNRPAIINAVEKEHPQQVLFLGDGLRDVDVLQEKFPLLPILAVPGNCDYGSFDEPERLIEIRGVRILMMHGHTRNVKYGTLSACYAAREAGAQILLYGHTHRPSVDYDGSLYVMNPGTIGDRARSTYGIITIDGSRVDCSTYSLL